MPKLRTFTASGVDERVAPSSARPTKPPAKELSKRKHAALGSGGGRMPPRMREELEREGTARRLKRLPRDPQRDTKSTRVGKRTPQHGRYVAATEMRDRREQRKSNTPETDPGAGAVPATRRTRNEPRAGKHRGRS